MKRKRYKVLLVYVLSACLLADASMYTEFTYLCVLWQCMRGVLVLVYISENFVTMLYGVR